jgi:serine protease
LERLTKIDSVARAYLEMSGSDPLVDSTDDVFAIQQRHLDAAPVGIDARWAWTQPHGSGASVGFVDLEQGWNFRHEDLPAIVRVPGVPQDVNPNPPSVRHGTGVLGIAVGVDNKVGIIGAAPTPAWATVASHFRAADGTSDHVADALTAVLNSGVLSAGDVILIEWQDAMNQPAEAVPLVWDAIELATALGYIVIEAAGNGNVDLDAVPEFNPHDPGFDDSRAIIVGGSLSALDATGVGHDRWVTPGPGSNFGLRVDCYAYAENVVTAGPTPNPPALLAGTGPNDSYRSDFGGTSAAAAIVAGAAVVLQGMHKAVTGTPLDPVNMRKALSTFGTPQGPGTAAQKIGVMPDLRKIAGVLDLVRSVPSAPTNLRIQR